MWKLFKPLANLVDHEIPDEGVDDVLDNAYGNAVGVIGWILLCILVCTVFVSLTWWRGSIFKPVEYLYVEPGKKPVAMQTLASPTYSVTRIQSWTARIISETLSFNYLNIDERLENATVFYTPAAASGMRGSIVANGLTDTVKSSRLNVTVTPLQSPRIVDFYIINGENTWVVETPVLMTYASSSSRQTVSLLVIAKVKAVDPAINPDGLLVSGFFTKVSR